MKLYDDAFAKRDAASFKWKCVAEMNPIERFKTHLEIPDSSSRAHNYNQLYLSL